MNCDQCQMVSINGQACHETGCPNERKTWVEERQEWIRYVDCFTCGYPVEIGETCDCQLPIEEEDEEFLDLEELGRFIAEEGLA